MILILVLLAVAAIVLINEIIISYYSIIKMEEPLTDMEQHKKAMWLIKNALAVEVRSRIESTMKRRKRLMSKKFLTPIKL